MWNLKTTFDISQNTFQGTCIKSISSETEITKAGFGQFIIQEEKWVSSTLVSNLTEIVFFAEMILFGTCEVVIRIRLKSIQKSLQLH